MWGSWRGRKVVCFYNGYLVWACSITQLCPTLCNPMDWRLPGSSVHGIFQARILEWIAISFSRGSSPPRWIILIVVCSSLLFSYLLTLGLEFLLILQGGTISTPVSAAVSCVGPGLWLPLSTWVISKALVFDTVMVVSSSYIFIIDLRDIWEDSEVIGCVPSTLPIEILITAIF